MVKVKHEVEIELSDPAKARSLVMQEVIGESIDQETGETYEICRSPTGLALHVTRRSTGHRADVSLGKLVTLMCLELRSHAGEIAAEPEEQSS